MSGVDIIRYFLYLLVDHCVSTIASTDIQTDFRNEIRLFIFIARKSTVPSPLYLHSFCLRQHVNEEPEHVARGCLPQSLNAVDIA